jgi:arylsulfatase A-like enzyme
MPLGPTTSLTRRGLLGGVGGAAVLGLTVDLRARATAGGAGATGAPLPGASALRGSTAAASRPNILLVVADDLGRGEVGAYGQKMLRTPILDRLAADGLQFDQAYATPTCAPTRFSLFTGLHTGHARVKENSQAWKGLRATDLTLGKVLRRAGYTTAIVGKWGLGPNKGHSPSHPNAQGFDHFFGYLTHRHAHDYWPTYLWRNGHRVHYPENARADRTFSGDLITHEALRFLDTVDPGSPFFLDVSYTTPHAPNAIPDATPYTRTGWPRGERNHAAQVTWTDRQVGLLLSALAERGLDRNTLVVVISDNGPHGEGAHYGHVGSHLPHSVRFFNSNGPLRGKKRSVHEGGIRIPMIVRVPLSLRTADSPAPGTVIRTPVAVWDLLPTFADLAGGRTPRRLDGISFVPTLRGRRQPRHDHLYWQYRGQRFGEAVRFGKWKAVRYDRGRVELYRIGRDPRERHDIARRHRAVARKAARLMHHAAA